MPKLTSRIKRNVDRWTDFVSFTFLGQKPQKRPVVFELVMADSTKTPFLLDNLFKLDSSGKIILLPFDAQFSHLPSLLSLRGDIAYFMVGELEIICPLMDLLNSVGDNSPTLVIYHPSQIVSRSESRQAIFAKGSELARLKALTQVFSELKRRAIMGKIKLFAIECEGLAEKKERALLERIFELA